jgi:hypothetical protein
MSDVIEWVCLVLAPFCRLFVPSWMITTWDWFHLMVVFPLLRSDSAFARVALWWNERSIIGSDDRAGSILRPLESPSISTCGMSLCWGLVVMVVLNMLSH